MTERGPRVRLVPAGDDRERLVCPDCDYVAYENPTVIVGSVVHCDDDRILMCRRAINPRKGFWTLPAGFLEMGETTEAGAAREAWEEARARIQIDALLAVYSITHISQIQLMYRARLLDPNVECGPESAEVSTYRWDEIPWSHIAFPSVKWALEHDRQVRGQVTFAPFGNPDASTGKIE